MTILPRLFSIFSNAGLEPMTGYSSFHFEGWRDAPFTRFLRGTTVEGYPGIALQELMLIEGFAEFLPVKNILVIGNAHGWSTVALSLIFPEAAVVALDPSEAGNALTNRMAQENGLRIKAVTGYSPQDVPEACRQQLSGPPDLVLIDADHTEPSMLRDFAACSTVCGDQTFWVFHDLINWKLVAPFMRATQEAGLSQRILTRTASGMGVAWKKISPEFDAYLKVFSDDPNIFRAYRKSMIDKYGQNLDGVLATI